MCSKMPDMINELAYPGTRKLTSRNCVIPVDSLLICMHIDADTMHRIEESICDAIKQNESKLPNISLKI